MSVAKCETGWGDGLSTRALLDVERPSPHPAARYTRVDPPPPGEGIGRSFPRPPLPIFPGFTRPYPFCLNFAHRIGGWASRCLFFRTKTGCDVRFLKRSGSSFKLPTLRFRAKIMLGFAVVLAISAASMGFAYLGFERVSVVVDSYRRSVQEADLARDIDRELISYRSLARYFVVTGARIPRLHQDFRRYPQGQGRERADRAKPADAQRPVALLQARRSPQQRR